MISTGQMCCLDYAVQSSQQHCEEEAISLFLYMKRLNPVYAFRLCEGRYMICLRPHS